MLPDVASRAVANARKADLAFVLGTSMNVQPAASYPPKVLRNKNGKVFNLTCLFSFDRISFLDF